MPAIPGSLEIGLPRLAIFDLDGTLIDFEHDHFFGSALAILDHMGWRGGLCAHSLRQRFERDDLWGFLPDHRRDELCDEFWLHFKNVKGPAARVIDGAFSTLDFFRDAGATIVIATARSEDPEEVEEDLVQTGLLSYVSRISSRGSNNPIWRDKCGQIQSLCREFGVTPAESIMVGDSPIDVFSGIAAGVGGTVALLTGGISEEILRNHRPDLLLPHVGHIPEHYGPVCNDGTVRKGTVRPATAS